YFYTTDERYRDEYVESVERFENTRATVSTHRQYFSIHVRRRDARYPVGMVEWAKRLGIWGGNAHQKHLPGEVFELCRSHLALLLARMWEGGGSLSAVGHASYDTVSRRLAEEVQHLLLRIGIRARLYTRTRSYRARLVRSYVVAITGSRNLGRFFR